LDRRVGRAIAGIVAAAALVSCGGGAPSSPSTGSSGGSGNPAITITIASSGVTPKQLQVSPGTRVLFTNNSSANHTMNSDPHPEHTDCPEINNIGFISPGQTKETGNLNTVRTCGYHDHDNPDNRSLQGTIVIR